MASPTSVTTVNETPPMSSNESTLIADELEEEGPAPMLREWHYPVPAVVVDLEEIPLGGAPDSILPPAAEERATPQTTTHHACEQHPFVTYTYPVATFVRDVVRTSIDQIQTYHQNVSGSAHQTDERTQQQQELFDRSADFLPFSVRSENDAQALSSMVSASPQHHHTVSARTVEDYMTDDAEFILVDGDLIALPPSNANRDLDGNNFHGEPKACRPSRMKRGVRKIGKWFGRGKKKNAGRGNSLEPGAISNNNQFLNAAAELSLPGVSSITEASQTEVTMSNDTVVSSRGFARQSSMGNNNATADGGGGASSSRAFARQTSMGESSASSPLKKSVKKKPADKKKQHQRGDSFQQKGSRRSWRQREEWRHRPTSEGHSYNSDEGGDEHFLQQQQQLSPAYLQNQGVAETGLLSAAQIQALREQLPSIQPPMPGLAPLRNENSGQSVIAQQIGTESEVVELQPGLLQAYVEYEYCDDSEKEKKEDIPVSLVPANTDYKVDKADAPDVESMLLRASYETNTDLDQPDPWEGPRPRVTGKSDGSSVPLSMAKKSDTLVHNDMLKVLLVGSVGMEKSALARAIRESTKRPRKRTTLGLDVHTWSASDVNFQIWDVQGSTTTGAIDSSPNFGTTPSVQSLFFSGESLYLLVWDLAFHNPHVNPVFDYESDEEEDESGNAYAKERAIAEADRALQEDISNRVLAWVDRIARRAPGSAILPVAIIPDGMGTEEVERRCSKMFEMLENHVRWHEGKEMPNIVLDSSRNVLCVNYAQNYGIKQIQETMVAIATDSSATPVFEHVNAPVPPGTVDVLEYIRGVKRDHKLIRLDHILGVLGDSEHQVDNVIRALHFLSAVGEILYFGTEQDDVLSSFVILSRQWLVSALSCILRNDLKRELSDARKFMNMQCIYSEQKFQENEVIKVLGGGSCPLLTDDDAAMLWRSMSFMREAADRYSQLNESTATAPTMFYFLERLLVHFGIFIPFGNLNQSSSAAGLEQPSEVFFVPSLLSQADPGDIWSYRSADSWTTTLCHSWLFRDGAPSELFEHIAVAVLRDIYLFSREFSQEHQAVPPKRDLAARNHTTPLAVLSQEHFMEEHQANPIGRPKIRQIICWKNAMLLKIGTIFPDRESNTPRESFVEVFVTIVDQNSSHCVASDAMRGNMQRVIVSGKGQSGLNGLKLFRGGYRAVLDSVKSSLETFNNVNIQVVCPECLARVSPGRASTWGYDEVAAAAEERRESTIVCRRGHRVKSGLLDGKIKEDPDINPRLDLDGSKPVPEILPGVVLVGLWTPTHGKIMSVGSGFVADKKFGLIVTAGHVLFDMAEGSNYGTPLYADAKVFIGVIPEKGKNNAVWRYFADILADDVRNNVDACVLRITGKMKHDVDDADPGCSESEIPLDPSTMKDENLIKLKVESNFELEENVRILGFGQREGQEESGSRHIIRAPDVAKGYICKVFSTAGSDDSSSSSSDTESRNTFSPREEIVVRCPTEIGNSGGPCVNSDGFVVGILSRADPTDRRLCYLVPAAQLRGLVRRARNLCSRPVFPSRETGMQSRFAQSF